MLCVQSKRISKPLLVFCVISIFSHVLIYLSDKSEIDLSDKQIFENKIVNIFLPISFNICFGCSKDPSP